MKPVDGMLLPSFPVPDLTHIRDLVYYDGPLLSHYEHPHGDDYLYYWCDCDDKANRWMVLRVSEASILRLVNRYVPLDFVIPNASRDGFVYLIDIGSDGRTEAVYIVSSDKVPNDYVPKAGTYLQAVDQSPSETSYSVLIEGGWSVEDLGEFPNIFGKVYALLYGLNMLHSEFESHPWRGGFSSMHFFNQASRRIPAEHKPNVAAIQYASPGFMRFRLHGPTAIQVTQCIVEYTAKKSHFAPAFSGLSKYIRDNGLNDIKPDKTIDWASQDGPLHEMTLALLKEFSAIDERDFIRVCPRPFEAAKIARAFYRFVRELANFEKLGRILYPKVSSQPMTPSIVTSEST